MSEIFNELLKAAAPAFREAGKSAVPAVKKFLKEVVVKFAKEHKNEISTIVLTAASAVGIEEISKKIAVGKAETKGYEKGVVDTAKEYENKLEELVVKFEKTKKQYESIFNNQNIVIGEQKEQIVKARNTISGYEELLEDVEKMMTVVYETDIDKDESNKILVELVEIKSEAKKELDKQSA